MRIFGRRTMGAVAMLSAGALALGGCSRGEGDETAQATDAASEQRVASLGLGDADTLLALGITPVTVARGVLRAMATLLASAPGQRNFWARRSLR